MKFLKSTFKSKRWCYREAPEGPVEPVPVVEAGPEVETPVIEAAEARVATGGITLSPEAFTADHPVEAAAIRADVTEINAIIEGDETDLVTGGSGADTLMGGSGDDVLTAPETTITAPLEAPALEASLATLRGEDHGLVISPEIEAEVRASFESSPFDTDGLTEAEIQAEIEVRVLAAKTEAMTTRMIETPQPGDPGLSESDYLRTLAEEHGLDPETLLIARARNQAGIGAGVDAEGVITDPEAYQAELETFATNYAAAQAYLEAHGGEDASPVMQARALAILNGADPDTIDESTPDQDRLHLTDLATDLRTGEAGSPIGRMVGGDTRALNDTGSGIGTIPLNPADLDAAPPLDLQTYEPGSEAAQQLFAEAARSNGMPAEWGASQGLHSILERESGGIVGRLNYTFGPVAENMGTDINDPQFISWVHQRLQEGATASDFGIRSTACGLGQCIRANVEAYYPSGFAGIGDPMEEAAGMLGYIQERYGNPDEAFRQYGVHHEGY